MGHLPGQSAYDSIMLTKNENRMPGQEGLLPQDPEHYNRNNGRRPPRPSAKPFCQFCKVIEERNLPAYSNNMQFTQDQQEHLLIKNSPTIRFPDRCGKFFKLSIINREQVLRETEFCPTCMMQTRLHGQGSCQAMWNKLAAENHKAMSVKCRESQCFKHWAMCPEHKTQNKKKYEELTSRCAWQFIQMAPGVHENAINHFWDQQEPIIPPDTVAIPHLNMPASPNITVESAHYFDNKQKRDPHDQPFKLTPKTKNLFTYYIESSTGDQVKVMADGGATISLLKHSEKAKLGENIHVGATTLTGVGNQQVSTHAPIVQFSLASSFNKKMKQFTINSAVIQTITAIPHTDLIHAIKTVLDVMHKRMSSFMRETEHYIKFDNFQTGYEGGDVDLLLGIPQLSLHPKIIVQFSNGPAIAVIRQPTKNNKFLILVGH